MFDDKFPYFSFLDVSMKLSIIFRCAYEIISMTNDNHMFQWTLISPEERDICTGWLPDLIHTSCRSESSNISLVVLDKVTLSPI